MSIKYEDSFASHEKSKYWSPKNEVSPDKISFKSSKKFYFICECKHMFYSNLRNIAVLNSWCPYCSIPSKKLCDDENCKSCFDKSFASHEKSKYWSVKNETTPRQVFRNSENKYIFYCNICNHDFISYPGSFVGKNTGCVYCTNSKLCDNVNCKSCFDKSFASHEKSKYWSVKNETTPRQVFRNSHKKYFFTCNICNHEFDLALNSYSKNNDCPFCSIPSKRLCDDENCKICFEKSFASHQKSKYWSPKNKKTPRQVTLKNNNKYLLLCENLHEFEAVIHNITDSNSWCPYCINKTENLIYSFIKDNFKIYNVVKSAKFDWAVNTKTKRKYEYDILINISKDINIIIEVDGDYHFIDKKNQNTEADIVRERDIYKMMLANKENYYFIRIFQEDVWLNKLDWKNILTDIITNCIFSCKDKNYYISTNKNLYDKHKEDYSKIISLY
jgi:hypothetical protein